MNARSAGMKEVLPSIESSETWQSHAGSSYLGGDTKLQAADSFWATK
jgi:hypothetical protein